MDFLFLFNVDEVCYNRDMVIKIDVDIKTVECCQNCVFLTSAMECYKRGGAVSSDNVCKFHRRAIEGINYIVLLERWGWRLADKVMEQVIEILF